jgi:DNA-binding XRE family transcriptional regulator
MEEDTPSESRVRPSQDSGQVQLPGFSYGGAVALRLIEAIAFTAREARKEARLKQSRVAAALNADQSTIARFEKGNWPEDLEATIRAYAEELEVDPAQLLHDGVQRWAESNGRVG